MTERDDEYDSADVNLKALFRPVLDVRWYIVVFVGSAIFSSLVLTYVFSEKYTAGTTIQFRPQEVTRLRQKEALAFGAPLPAPPFDLIYDNLELLVKSEPILLPVIDELNLGATEERYYTGPWYIQWFKRTKDWVKDLRDNSWTILKHGRLVEDDPRTAALKGVRKHLSLINHNSYVFYLTFVDKRPERAAVIVDKIAQRVVDALLQDQRKPGEMRKAQLQVLRDEKEAEIESYRERIGVLLASHGIASVEQEIERATARHSDLTTELIQLEGRIAATQARLAALEGKQLTTDSEVEPVRPEDYRRLRSEALFTEVELQALLEQQTSLTDAVSALERRLARLPEVQREHDMLLQHLKTAQRDFVQIADPYQEAIVQANEVLSEAVVIHDARVPSIPVTPIKIYHVGLAGGLALSIALGAAYLLAFLRSDQAAASLGGAISGVVGMWDGNERRRGDRRTGSAAYTGPERRRTGRRNED